jgi:hypothetical protein
MCPSLAAQFFRENLVTAEGYLLNEEQYVSTFAQIVCPTHEYYFLTESLEEMISVFRVIVRFTVSQTPASAILPDSFLEAALLLNPIVILGDLIDYRSSLITGWPSRNMSESYHERLRAVRRRYNLSFPSHGMRKLSRILRLCSWEMPNEQTIP